MLEINTQNYNNIGNKVNSLKYKVKFNSKCNQMQYYVEILLMVKIKFIKSFSPPFLVHVFISLYLYIFLLFALLFSP